MDKFENYTKDELINEIKALQAHNTQLRNIIAKNNASSKSQDYQNTLFDFKKCNFRHVLLKFIYLGWDYQGYVTQEDTANTIEHNIFHALKKACFIESREKSNYHRCGRTDKGVSSFSQVISIDLRSKSAEPEDELNYCKTLNKILPDDIRFVAWCPVPGDFSARFNCTGRSYKYFFPKKGLDIEQMKVGAGYLVGAHDFRNFCKMDVNNGVVEFIRNVTSVEINELHTDPDENFSLCVLTIRGNAFLWHQIRCIVSVLLLIGQNNEQPEIVKELLDVETNPRKPQYQMASEIPLNLYDCQYDNVKWIYDRESIDMVKSKLQNFWTINSIKSTMLKSMLIDLEKESSGSSIDCPSEFLMQSNQMKIYSTVRKRPHIPLMTRPLCDSLEDKIEHSMKRNKRKKPDPV